MNYKKIGETLLKENYVDNRMLICHSYRSYTATQDKVIYQKYERIGNDAAMPSFMLLSIKDDILHISFAKVFGGFKKHYAIIKLSNLIFLESFTIDKLVDVYAFNVIDDTGMRKDKFFIIAMKGKEAANKLVDAIIKYRKIHIIE